MDKPDNIRVLDDKPGRDWSTEEVDRGYRWWLEREPERAVWAAALRYLGYGATDEDVEEAWDAFYREEWQKYRRSYRPGNGPDFETYILHVCFKRECVRRGEEIRRRARTCVSLDVAAVEEGTCDDELLDRHSDPHVTVVHKQIIAEVGRFLEASDMPPNQRKAFELKHFDEMTNEEIACELKAEVGTIKVWAHRAAVRVQKHLQEMGWTN